MEYNFKEIEKKWQSYWKENKTYQVEIQKDKPKYYVLDMFPYPSGAGLHVGHPLGYIASDIYSRYKRLKGFNVLHPMGYDAYGLPAEQYAIQTGQHPAITTEKNINRYREQLDKIGFSFDWNREVRTCEPNYYKWTQWVFIQMFNSFYQIQDTRHKTQDVEQQSGTAKPISELISHFEKYGSTNLNIAQTEELNFTADEWKAKSEKEQQEILMNYRIAYLADTMVNWCAELGTVLANDEVVNGLSVRGGYPVEQRKMKQWSLRVSAYSQRLLDGLEKIDWSESIKETQKNWIGRSEGAEMEFKIKNLKLKIKIFTTRADTIYGVTFMVLAPESEYVEQVTTAEQKAEVEKYLAATKKRTERERQADKKVTGVFSGSYAINPISNEEIPIYISDYVLAGYGTGAIMAVPAHDSRDYAFARHFNLPIIPLIEGADVSEESFDAKDGIMINSPYPTPTLPKGEGVGISQNLEKNEAECNVPRYVTTDKLNWHLLIDNAKTMRKEPTEAESILWNLLRDKKTGYKFRRQHPINQFIPDFVCLEKKLIVEVDGDYHLTEEQKELDAARTYLLEEWGYKIIRFSNDNVINGYQYVVEKIIEELQKINTENTNEPSNSAHSLPFGEGRGGVLILNGLTVKQAIEKTKKYITENNLGNVKVNYRLRDAIFSRQRYWGEPFPIYYKDGMPYAVSENDLPIELPEIDKFLPTETGEPPLGRAKNWEYGKYPLELNTMPGFAGSSAYYLRYEDPKNDEALVSKEANEYWGNVDLYLGGSEHATGHLIYSRFWNKFLYDLGVVKNDEPFQKLINQGMIQGRSNFVYRINSGEMLNKFVSYNLKNQYDTTEIHVDVNIVSNDILDIEKFKKWRPEFADAEFILEYPTPTLPKGEGESAFHKNTNIEMPHTPPPLEGAGGRYVCGYAVEKMSKSMFNVVNPDDIVEKYGADTLRLYEMFLGPLEFSKPWDTNGIDGVHRFLKRLWSLVYNGDNLLINNEQPTADELKILHKTIKKITFDIENFSFNTSVSAFMICVNELYAAKCSKRAIIEPLVILLAPFAPHIAEEIYHLCGNETSICDAKFPLCEEKYLVEDSVKYPVSFNGKVRFTLELPADTDPKEVEKTALSNEQTPKWLDGKAIKKVIVVPKKIVNIVL